MRSLIKNFLPTGLMCLVRFCLSSGKTGLTRESLNFTTLCTSKTQTTSFLLSEYDCQTVKWKNLIYE